MKSKTKIQNKIRFVKFFVESLNYKCNNIELSDINEELDIELKITSAFSDNDLKSYLIKIEVDLSSKDSIFKLSCKVVGFFETIEEINEEFKSSSFVKINSPAILFPFIRSYINTITTNSGISPIILPSINFA